METGRKLLLADDSVTIQKVIGLTFNDEGLDVTTVSDGEQALAKLEEVAPDIVLADIHMPKVNGYQVCERIKRDERFHHVPVMLLVGSFEPFDEEEARRVGADDYLTKPFQSIRQLVNKVGALLGGRTAEDEAPTLKLTSPAETSQASSQADAGSETHTTTGPSAEALELQTADTAPLAEQVQEEPVQASELPEPPALESVQDEETISTAPPVFYLREEETGDEEEAGDVVQLDQPAPAAETEEAETILMNKGTEHQFEEAGQPLSVEPLGEESYASAGAGLQANFIGRADDSLLDLGEVETPPVEAGADDFILDLQDEEFYRKPQPLEATETAEALMPSAFEDEVLEIAPQSDEHVQAQATGDEQDLAWASVAPPVSIAEAPQSGRMAETGPLAESSDDGMAAAGGEPAMAAASASLHPGQITLDQLSPEAIDAIARRAVELLSERVVQDIAWEVVPQLAELLIKRRLEEQGLQAK